MKVRVIGDQLLVGLFRVAGVPGVAPLTPEAIEAAVEAYLAEAEVGVVLVGSSLAAQIGTKFREYLQRRKLPLVLRIPDRRDQEGCAGEIREYLQRTLGIRL